MMEYLTESDPATFWNHSQSALADLGVSSICYATILSRSEAQLKGLAASIHHRSTHSREWIDEIERDNNFAYGLTLADLDTVFAQPVVWHEEHKQGLDTPEARRFYEFENDLGLGVGATIQLASFQSAGYFSALGLAFQNTREPDFHRTWNSNHSAIRQIGNILDARLRSDHSCLLVRLSRREREVLTCLAAGYRPDQIADRLHRSHKTIDKYIQSAKRKLKASTRDHAVAKALTLQLISP
jgi:DNA-binding CsgD family transcriptional regulator